MLEKVENVEKKKSFLEKKKIKESKEKNCFYTKINKLNLQLLLI